MIYIEILTILSVDVIVGYVLQKYVEKERLRKRKYFSEQRHRLRRRKYFSGQSRKSEQFNEEYFDLYWNRNVRDIDLLVKFILMSLLLFSEVYFKGIPISLFESTCALVLSVVVYIISSLFVAVVSFSILKGMIFWDELDNLIDIKGQSYVSYSDKEKEIIGRLF